jgi:hypothetical protein
LLGLGVVWGGAGNVEEGCGSFGGGGGVRMTSMPFVWETHIYWTRRRFDDAEYAMEQACSVHE